jgi:hypothetical protein
MDMDAALALSARGMRGTGRSPGRTRNTPPRGRPAADPADPADPGGAHQHRSANHSVLCTTRGILTRAALILTKT